MLKIDTLPTIIPCVEAILDNTEELSPQNWGLGRNSCDEYACTAKASDKKQRRSKGKKVEAVKEQGGVCHHHRRDFGKPYPDPHRSRRRGSFHGT